MRGIMAVGTLSKDGQNDELPCMTPLLSAAPPSDVSQQPQNYCHGKLTVALAIVTGGNEG